MGALIRNAVVRRKDFGDSQPVQAEGKPKVYTFVASDGEFDRYNDRLDVKGWDLAAFSANPVILLNHDTGSGGLFTPPSKILPIGKGRAYVAGSELLIDVTFDQEDPDAVRVEKKLAGGFMNTGSVRYIMKDYTENERGGYDSKAQELLEFSVVTLPGNSRAVRIKDFSDIDLDALAAALAPHIARKDAGDEPADDKCDCGCPQSKCEPPQQPQQSEASFNPADLASALSAEISRLTSGN